MNAPPARLHCSHRIKTTLFQIIVLVGVLCLCPLTVHPAERPLVVAMSADFRPFTFVNAQGEPAGMFVDIWRLWSQKTGQPIRFLVSDWQTSLDNLKTGKADVHSGVVHSPQRTVWLAPLPVFYPTEIRYFQRRQEAPLEGLTQLAGSTVAVVRGGVPEEYLQTNFPDIQLRSYSGRDALPAAVRSGETRGFVMLAPVAAAMIDRLGLTGVFDKNGLYVYSEEFSPGVPKEQTALIAQVRNGFATITRKELAGIEATWIEDPAKRRIVLDSPILTKEELGWIKAHPVVRVGMSPVLPPLKFIENGVIKGVEPDFLAEIAARTGLKFEFVVCTFSEMDDRARVGDLDMFLSFDIPSRREFMDFTSPFMDFKHLLVSRTETPYLSSLASLDGKRVATVKGVKLHEKALAPYPGVVPVPCNTMEEMFRVVASGKADALLTRTLYAGYLLNNFPQLKIAGVLDLPPEPYLYAVRKDYPELVGILDKGIAAVPHERLDAIVQRWLTLRVEYHPRTTEILRWVILTAALCSVVGGGVTLLLWNQQLRRQVALKSEELLREVAAREKTDQMRLYRQQQDMFRLSEIIALSEMNDVPDRVVYDRILDDIVTLTDSLYGYIYFYDESTELFTLHAWSEQVAAACSVVDPQTEYSLKKTGYWGEVVRQRSTVINNDFAEAHPLKKGYPAGHAPIVRFMSVPVFSGDQIVAVAGVANKVEPYTSGDALVLQDFCQGIWNVIGLRQEHRQFLDEQMRYRRLFEALPVPCAKYQILFDELGAPCDYRFLLVNQSFADLFGRSPDKIVGRTARELTPHAPPLLLDRFADVALGGIVNDFEFVVAQTGQTLRIRCHASRKDTVVAMATDVTAERRLLEKDLREEIERQERLRFSRDLHDSSGQTFQTIRLYLNLIEDGRMTADEIPQVAATLDGLVAEAYEELREIAHQLRPNFLRDNLLDGAIRIRCERLRKRGLPVSFTHVGNAAALPFKLSEHLYRIFQEALSNAAFHAAATSIEVSLECNGAAGLLVVSDNGCGMSDKTGGVGLHTMRERAKLINANFVLESSATGTSVTVAWEAP